MKLKSIGFNFFVFQIIKILKELKSCYKNKIKKNTSWVFKINTNISYRIVNISNSKYLKIIFTQSGDLLSLKF